MSDNYGRSSVDTLMHQGGMAAVADNYALVYRHREHINFIISNVVIIFSKRLNGTIIIRSYQGAPEGIILCHSA